MRLSAFSVLDAYDGRLGDRPGELLELAGAAERLGLHGLWVAEHHFHDGGACPAPPVLLAAVAASTRRIRLGPMAAILPFHEPVALAEEYATVDRLSRGRLRLGVGSGYVAREFEGFGADPVRKRATFDARLARLQELLDTGELGHRSSAGEPLRLNVRPVQRPGPPIWVAAQRPESLPHVAARNVSAAVLPYASVDDLPSLVELVRSFRRARPPGGTGEIGVVLHLYAGAAPERARRALQRYLDSRMATRDAFWRDDRRVAPHPVEAARIERAGFACFGDPGEFAGTLAELRRAGVDEVLGMFDFGGLRPSEVRESLDLWARADAFSAPAAPAAVDVAGTPATTATPRHRAPLVVTS